MVKSGAPKKAARRSLKASRAAISKSKPRLAERLLGDIRQLIEQARHAVAQTVNAGLVLMNWHIGQRIRTEILTRLRLRPTSFTGCKT
jgi:hypothetical protein